MPHFSQSFFKGPNVPIIFIFLLLVVFFPKIIHEYKMDAASPILVGLKSVSNFSLVGCAKKKNVKLSREII